jgi:4-hydroxy-3-methylbut-2-enyl diphosphate reductase
MADHLGLCYGVRRALEMAEKSIDQGDTYSLGDLIHSPQEMSRLERAGLHTAESLADVQGGTLLLRTHGTPPEMIEAAKQRGLKIADATCPHVRAAQKAAAALTRDGYVVVIVGDPDHPEVQSVVRWAGCSGSVVRSAEEASGLAGEKFGVISQTTEQDAVVDEVIKELRAKGVVKVVRTVCQATSERQAAVRDLAKKVRTIIVVGGRNSANTRQLARIAEREGAITYLIEEGREIQRSWVSGETEVGVAAGASTPDWIIKEVVDVLEEMEKQPVPEESQAQATEEKPSVEAPKVGDIVEATVVSVDDNGAMVDIGFKAEGVVERKELSKKPDAVPSEVCKPGDKIHVMVLAVETDESPVKLSKRRADDVLTWNSLREAMGSGATVEAPVTQQVKGGLVVDVGLRGFVPASQVERGFVSDLAHYVGQTLTFKVIEIDKSKNRVILSRRAVLEEEAEKMRKDAWERIHEGDVLKGTVKSLTDFGAFVDLGGVDGLLHVSEMSWGRVTHPSDVLAAGQEIDVKVLRVDQERGRISLGYKQVLPDPWSVTATKYPEGAIVKGKVTRIAPFGAFVELESGVEGLVHISELSSKRITRPDEVVNPGDEVTAKVLRVRPQERRISLSLKEADIRPAKPERAEKAPQPPDRVTLGDVIGEKLQEAKENIKPEKE